MIVHIADLMITSTFINPMNKNVHCANFSQLKRDINESYVKWMSSGSSLAWWSSPNSHSTWLQPLDSATFWNELLDRNS